jgi:hypothetical protein
MLGMNAWLLQWFNSDAASKGDPIRRRIRDVESYTSLREVEDEVRRRGWHMLIYRDQVLVLPGDGQITIVC